MLINIYLEVSLFTINIFVFTGFGIVMLWWVLVIRICTCDPTVSHLHLFVFIDFIWIFIKNMRLYIMIIYPLDRCGGIWERGIGKVVLSFLFSIFLSLYDQWINWKISTVRLLLTDVRSDFINSNQNKRLVFA